jgi:hypothetical protein
VGGLHTAADGTVSLIVKVTAAPGMGRSKTVPVTGNASALEALVAESGRQPKEE